MARPLGTLAALAAVLLVLGGCPADEEEPVAAPQTPVPSPTDAPPAPDDCLDPASDTHPISRLGDEDGDPAGLAVCASVRVQPDDGGDVVLGGLDGEIDLVVAVHLAHRLDAPMLLAGDELPDVTAAELVRRSPERVVAVGSSDVLGDAALEHVVGLLPDAEVVRVDEDPAAAVAGRSGEGSSDPSTAAIVGAADRPADALLAAGAAGLRGATLLLAAEDGLPGATADALDDIDAADVVGGRSALSDAAEAEVRERLSAGAVRRLAGPDLAETAASIARTHPGDGPIMLVDPEDTAALAVAAWSAGRVEGGGSILASDHAVPPRGTDRFLRLGGLEDREVWLVGGEEALGGELVEGLELRADEAAAGGPEPQMRGVWIHLFDDTLKTRAGIDAMLDDAVRAGLNTVIVEVVRRHDAYHVSDVLPRAPDPELEADLDVLARTLDGAAARGLEVHAWAPLMPVHHAVYDDLDLPPDHVYRRHGPGSDDPWVTVDVDGQPNGEYLDPGVPAVREHVAAMMAEIAARYPVDAIHIDYPRYPGERYGYNPAALARFHEETGRSDRPSPTDGEWNAWRRAQTTALVEGIAHAVRDADPDVAISLASISLGAHPGEVGGFDRTRAITEVMQPWPTWLADGLVDAIYPMHYFREGDDDQRSWYRGWLAFDDAVVERCEEARDAPCTVAAGIGAWLNPLSDSLRQLELAIERTGGVVIYSYQQNTADEPHDGLLEAVADGPFAEPAPSPPLR